MIEAQSESFEGKTMHFEISAPTIEDAGPIGPVHLQSWIETYQNPSLGVDEAWIRENMGHVAAETGDGNGLDFRTNLFREIAEGKKDVFYRIAKDQSGEIVGFCVATKGEASNGIDALYLLRTAQGQGLGAKLMDEMLEYCGSDKPIKLDVIKYNQHAIDFYKRYGFELTGKEETFKDPVTAVEMVRQPQ